MTCSTAEQATFLRDGRADVGLMHRPHADLSGLDSEDLLTEEQVAMLPARHRLAARPLLRLADLQGETMPRRLGGENDTAPVVHSLGELQQLVALGRMVALVPASLRDQVRHDLVGIPVIDAPPTSLVIAWPPGGHSAPRAAFVHAATTVAHRARRHSSRPRPFVRSRLGGEETRASNE